MKTEPIIDPQLSEANQRTPSQRNGSLLSLPYQQPPSDGHSPCRDSAARHRAHVPHMRARQPSPSPTRARGSILARTPQLLSDQDLGSESGSDYFRTFLRTPTRTAYPDPSKLTSVRSADSSVLVPQITKANELSHTDEASDNEKSNLTLSPILKGVKWPGMSLFDSASAEAQRRRNQKKDTSILELMEQNSLSVEQIECIYWPDGSFKKQRLITGNVESSPMQEPTPPPPPKRQRTKAKQAVLDDLSTNIPKPPRKYRPRKPSDRMQAKQALKLRDLSGKALSSLSPPRFTYPEPINKDYTFPTEQSDSVQERYHLPGDRRHRNFDVYQDELDDRTTARPSQWRDFDSSFTQGGHGHQGLRHPSAANFTLHRKECVNSSWDSQLRAFATHQRFSGAEDRENIEPVLDSDGRVDDNAAMTGSARATQRYFSVTGAQSPQFFNTMPPQMDFGGLGGPRYIGSSLNPLNAYLRHPHFPQQPSRMPFAQATFADTVRSDAHAARKTSPTLGEIRRSRD